MRRAWAGTAIAIALATAGIAGQGDETSVPRVSVAELQRGLETGRMVAVDVRDTAFYRDGHIPGAVSLPLADVASRAASLKPAGKVIVTYCA